MRAHRPDVAVLDIRMPHLDDVEAAAEPARTGAPRRCSCGPRSPTTPPSRARPPAAGPSGFVLKTGPQEIIAGVRAVASGAAYLSPLITRRVLDGLPTTRRARDAHARVAALTDREPEVLGLIGAGLSNAESRARCTWSRGR